MLSLPSVLLIFALYIYVLLCWVHIYLQVSYPLDELTPLSLHSDVVCLFWLTGYFIWQKYSLSSLFWLSFTWNIFFHPFTFRLQCVINVKMSLLKVPNFWFTRADTGLHHDVCSPSPMGGWLCRAAWVWGRVKGEMWNCLSSLLQCIFSYLFHPGSVIFHLNP